MRPVQNPGSAFRFQHGGTFYILPSGTSEWPDEIANRLMVKYADRGVRAAYRHANTPAQEKEPLPDFSSANDGTVPEPQVADEEEAKLADDDGEAGAIEGADEGGEDREEEGTDDEFDDESAAGANEEEPEDADASAAPRPTRKPTRKTKKK